MIPIQVPEHLKKQLTTEFDKQRNTHNHLSGRFAVVHEKRREAHEKGDTEATERYDEDLSKLRLQMEEAWRTMYMAEGGLNVVNYLIQHENMNLKPLTMESITRLEEVVLEGEKVEA